MAGVQAEGAKGRPLIGVAPRYEAPATHFGETLSAGVAETTNYLDAIVAAGGMPVVLPLTEDEDLIRSYVDLCDGISVPGGPDVDPRLFGDETPYDEKLMCPPRDRFEVPLLRATLEADKPLLTICRGTQMLNVVLGGTLCMDVPGLQPRPGMALWRHGSVLTTPAHPVEVREGSLLARCMGGAGQYQVNSAHHCCVGRLGEGAVLVAEATDGVPEAIEVPGRRFCLGVQWHPEFTWGFLPHDFAIWKAFVAAAAGRVV